VTPVRKKTKGRAKRAPSKGRATKKSASAARKKTKAKTATRKAATKKTAAPKAKAKPKAPARSKAPVRESPPAAVQAPVGRRRAGRARPKAPRAPLPTPATPAGVEPRSRLGGKHVCFECGAKFYDLNRPEPLCPKCGADQRNRPAREVKLKAPPGQVRRPGGRAMAPLLVDDEEESVVHDEPEVDLALTVIDPVDALVDEEETDDSEVEEP
jgi:hypothetical protein